MEKGTLSINSENIMPIIKKWLYSDTDIFLRELVSNGTDAITKLQKLHEMGEANFSEDEKFKVTVLLNKEENTIKIIDNGLGMTDEEIKKYINQIAFSGASDFVEKYKDQAGNEIIGHFGLGFYSAFMVSDKVQIDSLSHVDGAKAARWISDGGTSYEMGESDKKERGTEITLFVSEEHQKEFLAEYKLREILEKYCAFMPIEIFLETEGKEKENNEPINITNPLWVKKPSECTDEEYKDFYKKAFREFQEPLFWIHLNMDHPFTLKGILYFPKLKNAFEQTEGQVKLFCNQVFVADNVKEVIPEFLLLLKGVIDCPDIPLNVSRSFLQNDANVAKMSGYVSKKVADKLNSIYKKDKDEYIKYRADISPFIKYGCIKEKNFYEKMEKSLIYKTTTGDYVTLEKYLDRNKENHENKVFYVSNEMQQSQYIKMFKEQQMEAVILDTNLDSAFISCLETYNRDIAFNRIDSDLSETLKAGEEVDEESSSALSELFKSNLNNTEMKVKVENLKSESVPAVILLSEHARRMQEMSKMFAGGGIPDLPVEEELVLNKNNALVNTLLSLKDDDSKKEEVGLICSQIYDLARMSQKTLSAEEMSSFMERSNKIMQIMLK